MNRIRSPGHVAYGHILDPKPQICNFMLDYKLALPNVTLTTQDFKDWKSV
jgi:hypothetical protein